MIDPSNAIPGTDPGAALLALAGEVACAVTEAGVYSALVAAVMLDPAVERAAVVRRSPEGDLTVEAAIGLTPTSRAWLQSPERRRIDGLLTDLPGEAWGDPPERWGDGLQEAPAGLAVYPIGGAGRADAWLLLGLDRPLTSAGPALPAMLVLAAAAAGHLRAARDLDLAGRALQETGGVLFERVRANEWVYRGVSPALAALLGHPAEELESGRRSAVAIKAPEDRERCGFEIERAVASRTMRYATEYRVVRADGTTVRVREHGRVAGVDGRGPARVLGVLMPVGEARPDPATAGAVAPVFEDLPLGVCDVDLSGRVRRANAALAAVLGVTPAALAGVGLEDLLHADELAGHRDAWQDLTSGRRRVFQAPLQRWRHADGSFRLLRVCGFATSFVADGRPFVRYVVVDGGEAARLEEDLRRTSAKVESFFEQASVGMAELGLDGRFMSANPRLGEILGCGPAELLGLEWQRISHPEDVRRCESRLAEIAAGRLGTFTLEKRYLRKDGGVVWGLVSIAAIRDAAGKPERFAVVLTELPGPRPDAPAPAAAAPAGRRRLRVLVVDDEPGVRDTVAAMLAHHHFEVETASSLAEARAAAPEPVDVVLWDAGLLASADGVGEVEAAFPGSAVVVMSGNPELVRGPNALRKPFSVEDLAATVLRAAGVRSSPSP